jgi:hypothetical protein
MHRTRSPKEHRVIVVGTPHEVIRKLEQLENIGMDRVICLKQAGRIPHANIVRCLPLGRHYHSFPDGPTGQTCLAILLLGLRDQEQ